MAAKKRKSRKKGEIRFSPCAFCAFSRPIRSTLSHIRKQPHRTQRSQSEQQDEFSVAAARPLLRYVIFVFFVVMRLSIYGSASQKEHGRKKAHESQNEI